MSTDQPENIPSPKIFFIDAFGDLLEIINNRKKIVINIHLISLEGQWINRLINS
jgi:hypothetical protein